MVQLSAFNTPQFDWARTCLPRAPQPLAPIYAPELAARAIVWAARHRRREVWVGWPTCQAIIDTRLLPGLLDRILAKRAWRGQCSDLRVPSVRPDNLIRPVDGDHGAHGRFDRSMRKHSIQFWFSVHRPAFITTLTALALGVLLAWIST